ncbi:hypothetical protein CKO15_10280 [Halorhodospira abdelmalekii]|uniref:hypothetical protein n=1 Tax=Halorhodospira abdelmalekii TaxID=421629 RepID=UPI001903B2D6|nr:hypothetical protein [Halorhodospira abdelmalekii]MBK1735663.1 hypothetical protein [Halorhodospira abdelmalekii]
MTAKRHPQDENGAAAQSFTDEPAKSSTAPAPPPTPAVSAGATESTGTAETTARTAERKAIYTLSDAGRIEVQAMPRCEAECWVTELAIEEYQRLAAEAWQQAHAGRSSPLAYHMYQQRMEPGTLAQASGLWRWQVRRHCRSPRAFARLNQRTLERYARILGISVDSLTALPATPPTAAAAPPASRSNS